MQQEISARLPTISTETGINYEIPISTYISIFKNRKWHFLAILLSTILTTFLITYSIPPTYKAKTTILLAQANPNPLEEQTNQLTSRLLTEYINTEISIVKTRAVSIEVMKQLKLRQHPTILKQYKKYQNGSYFSFLQSAERKDIETWIVDYLMENIEVSANRDSRILEITFENGFPEFAAKIANGFAQAYDTYHLELNIAPIQKNIDWITQKINKLRKNVGVKDKIFETYKAKKGLINTEDRQSIAIQKLNQLNAKMVTAETMFFEAKIKMKRLLDLEKKENGYAILPVVISNTFIQGLKLEKIKSEKTLSELTNRVGNKHPQYLKNKSDLHAIKERITKEISNIVESIKSEYVMIKRNRYSLQAALLEHKQKVLKLNEQNFELNMLRQETVATRNIYDILLSKFSEMELKGDVQRTNVTVLDKAIAPSQPASPRIYFNIAISIVVGFFLGILAVLIIENLDNTVKDTNDIEMATGIPVLVVIPKQMSPDLISKKTIGFLKNGVE